MGWREIAWILAAAAVGAIGLSASADEPADREERVAEVVVRYPSSFHRTRHDDSLLITGDGQVVAISTISGQGRYTAEETLAASNADMRKQFPPAAGEDPTVHPGLCAGLPGPR